MRRIEASQFAFVPRKLAKSRARPTPQLQDASRSRKTLHHTPESRPPSPLTVPVSASETKRKEDKYLDDKAYIALFELALSEHAIWSSTELQEAMDSNEDGFIPISYLVRSSQTFAGLDVTPPESTLMRCVKASNVLEGRIMISEPNTHDWKYQRRGYGAESDGGFEVRRRDWSKVKEQVRKYTSFHWDSKTIYIENLPYYAKTYHAIYQFIQQLLAKETGVYIQPPLIQSISFPPHQKDDPDSLPPITGKGFAFLVLSNAKDMDHLLKRWPWKLGDQPSGQSKNCRSKAVDEAREFGFRCLSKREWNKLKEEYLSLQARLLEKTMASSVPGPSYTHEPTSSSWKPSRTDDQEAVSESAEKQVQSSPVKSNTNTWFPADCLVFAKNVHPETNKTTLRVLLSSAFDGDTSPIDYVDYNKGLDSCYLRLSAPQHARTLFSYFSEQKTLQSNALDSMGISAGQNTPIEINLVQGKKEEVYWEKVPDKIRNAAIVRLEGSSESVKGLVQGTNEVGPGGRKRKRRRRD